MNHDDLQFFKTLKRNVRRHAGSFSWLTDRTAEEENVVGILYKSLAQAGAAFFHSYQSRGEGNDPPDCEAVLTNGGRLGIEVTELVDGLSIHALKSGKPLPWQPFTEQELRQQLADRIARKDKLEGVKGGPYQQYMLVIYCDEPRVLDSELIQAVRRATFSRPKLINRAFLLFSYSPWEKRYPYIELSWAI